MTRNKEVSTLGLPKPCYTPVGTTTNAPFDSVFHSAAILISKVPSKT